MPLLTYGKAHSIAVLKYDPLVRYGASRRTLDALDGCAREAFLRAMPEQRLAV